MNVHSKFDIPRGILTRVVYVRCQACDMDAYIGTNTLPGAHQTLEGSGWYTSIPYGLWYCPLHRDMNTAAQVPSD